MLDISQQEARRRLVARTRSLQSFGYCDAYNTGASVTTTDAAEYANLWVLVDYLNLAKPEVTAIPHQAVETRFLCLSTGASEFQVNTVALLHAWRNTIEEGFATPSKIIATVRDIFMLSIRDTAEVMRVSRPTIYQWQELEDMLQIRAHQDRDRLKHVYRLATEWNRLGKLQGKWLTLPLAKTGKSVLDILTAEAIDDASVFAAHEQIAAMANDLAKDRRRRTLEAANKLKTAFAKLGELEHTRRKDPP